MRGFIPDGFLLVGYYTGFMRRQFISILSLILFALPAAAFADSVSTNAQLIALYTQLITVLRQELALLQAPSSATLSVTPVSGPAPLTVIFTVNNPSGTEVIDFGDGHSSGSNGCVKNAEGWCDLSKPIEHTYQFSGVYTVALYRHKANTTQTLGTTTVSMAASQ
jgi:hypothetical protein